ncbi:AraC-like DNA-binding protein [Pedobacter sp. UYEF25]
MLINEIECKTWNPPEYLKDFVENIWMFTNPTHIDHPIVNLPDGKFDIIFSLINKVNFQATIKGLDTEPAHTIITSDSIFFAVSFKLLAVEYLLEEKVDSIINKGTLLPNGFWNIEKQDLDNFAMFCEKVSSKILTLIKPCIDNRKQRLFDLIYSSNGTLSVKELSRKVYWSSRQINRYFNQTFGISLKTYCNIFRFKTSLHHIKKANYFLNSTLPTKLIL